MKEYTTEDKVNNAIKWLEALRSDSGFRKTTNILGKLFDRDGEWSDKKDFKEQGKFCCLGVGCVITNTVKQEADNSNWVFFMGREPRLDELLGFIQNSNFTEPVIINMGDERYAVTSLVSLNDMMYPYDEDFGRVRQVIMDNLELLFTTEVAEGLKKHFHVGI